MYYIFYTFITATLGLLRDYSKHKQIILTKFIRTPIMCFIIHNLIKYYNNIYNNHYNHYKNHYNNNNNNIIYAIIYERWFMLIFKTALSFYNNDYVNKHTKYIIKYKDLYNKNNLNNHNNHYNHNNHNNNHSLSKKKSDLQLYNTSGVHIV